MFWLASVSSNSSDDGLQGPYNTLTEAAEDRIVAAQVVVNDNGHIVKDDTWLWDWERNTGSASYAWRMLHGEGEWVARHNKFGTGWQSHNPVLPPGHYKDGR
jgi:hypothetical protein